MTSHVDHMPTFKTLLGTTKGRKAPWMSNQSHDNINDSEDNKWGSIQLKK